MEQTFITIHNLSPDANVLFASESIVDILGYQPQDVLGKSCFEYFHPDEVPFARHIHSRGVLLDKAAVLHYMKIMSRDGQWISCECCFTIVHDVLVACTSVYKPGFKSQRRAIEAPQIRRIFSSSPRDPRYQMLEHLSPKFKMPPMEREPRAALILNRFTRTLTVMFATNAVASILGVSPDEVQGKSFYECIAENCLADAVSCLESAKKNDSIAYLRFWYRDPRREEDFNDEEQDDDDEEESSSSDSDGGAPLETPMDIDTDGEPGHHIKAEAPSSPCHIKAEPYSDADHVMNLPSAPEASGMPSSSSSQAAYSSNGRRRRQSRQRRRQPSPLPSFELEAVVSCTSDGLVVVLRKARPPIPALHPPMLPVHFENGLFAAPWGQQPMQPHYAHEAMHTFRPPLMPQFMPLQEHVKAMEGPPIDLLMRSIRDVAVFAWALTGINGNLAAYGRGIPGYGSQPYDGLPVWEPQASQASHHAGYQHSQQAHAQAQNQGQAHMAWPPPTLAVDYQSAIPTTPPPEYQFADNRLAGHQQSHQQHSHQDLGSNNGQSCAYPATFASGRQHQDPGSHQYENGIPPPASTSHWPNDSRLAPSFETPPYTVPTSQAGQYDGSHQQHPWW